MISTNHYQAPVRRFILDLFDVPFESDTLLQLCHIELASYASPRSTQNDDQVGNGTEENEARRRSASSPGPEPPGRLTRTRGLTVSDMRLVSNGYGHPDEYPSPKERVRGFAFGSAMR